MVEWARRPFLRNGGSAGEGNGSFELQEILVKCRVGRFPKQMGFYLLVRKVCMNSLDTSFTFPYLTFLVFSVILLPIDDA